MRKPDDSSMQMLLRRLGRGLGLSGLAFLLLGFLGSQAAAEPEEAEQEAEEAPEGLGEASPPPGLVDPASPANVGLKSQKPVAKRRGRGRRRVSGHVISEDHLRRRFPPPPSGNLYLHRPIEKESLKLNIFNPDGSYNVDAIQAASRMLRCRRTDTAKEMEPRLLTILSHVFDRFGERRIDVVSGFRNQRKTTSYHYKGSAVDVRVEGISARRLQEYVETLDSGGMGIGIYPVTGFVHIDVRPPPSYRWVDYSPSNPDAQQKRPPPWFKRRRLQS
jgi:uncharacterized protein YcbK (DUF882 family)